MNNNSEKTPNPFSFRFSYDSMPRKKQIEVRKQLRQLFGVKGDASVYLRINGDIEPKASEVKAIEQIFKSYGVKVVWGKNSDIQ